MSRGPGSWDLYIPAFGALQYLSILSMWPVYISTIIYNAGACKLAPIMPRNHFFTISLLACDILIVDSY